jgi:nucleoside-diphosphate-sugar epimerase
VKISVFGGSGFIGSNFQKYSKHEIDLVDRSDSHPIFPEILYLIGTTDNYNVFSAPKLDIEVNLILLIENLEKIRLQFKESTFNFISSWFVYGDAQNPPFNESGPCNPKGFYSISKYAAEKYVQSYCETFGISYRILRLGNVFGCDDRGISRKKNALQFIFGQLKRNEKIELYDNGDFFRDYIDVRDVVYAIDLIVESKFLNEVVNIGTGSPQRFGTIVEEAKVAYESCSEIVGIKPPQFHAIVQVKSAWLNTEKLESLGFRVRYPLNSEIRNL